MPNTRWWAFEDRKTNFGDVDAATTDLAKLLLLEFGLVYANDWFLFPLDVPARQRSPTCAGCAVTNVFGERFWIEPAGAGPDDAWQRWSMFTVNVKGDGEEPADTSLLLLPTVPKIQEGDPIEEVALIRDEMANMVWGVERTIPLPSGDAKRGAEAGRETRAYLTRLLGHPESAPTPRVADVRYEIMSSVPEQWIPFVPVHVPGDVRAIQLQRAGLPRIIEGRSGDPARPAAHRAHARGPRPADPELLRRARGGGPARRRGGGPELQRTRWRGGRTVTWLGVGRGTGRGEGSSGLAFDRLVDVPPEVP